MSQWIYMMRPPRDDFMATMTASEHKVLDDHRAWLRQLDSTGALLLAGPCLGTVNTGIMVFEAADEHAANAIVAQEPLSRSGYMRGELMPYRVDFIKR